MDMSPLYAKGIIRNNPLYENGLKLNDNTNILQLQNALKSKDINEIIKALPPPPKGEKPKHLYNGRYYSIHSGKRGGQYILVGKDKRKVYVKAER